MKVDARLEADLDDTITIRIQSRLKRDIEEHATVHRVTASTWARICLESAHGWPLPEFMRGKKL